GEDRACVAAAHGDDDVGGLDGVGGEDLGLLGADVDAVFEHGVDGDGVDLVGGGGAGGPDLDGSAGQGAQVPGGHLGAAGVVDADEQGGRLRGGGGLGHGGLPGSGGSG